jgi:uncharacterized protein YjdB/beta-N-acetylglucosaminidase
MRKKTFVRYIVFFCVFLVCIMIRNISFASVKKEGIENFPESYRPYLYELKKKHPNWVFTALYTGIDWNYAISQEYRNDKNLVPKSYSDYWKCTDNGIYDVEIDAGWVNASKSAVEYTMDPRNFLNEVRMFQFEKLTYDPNTNTKDGVEKVLYGTEFHNRQVTYKTSSGASITMNAKYSDLIWNSAVYSGVSPYHLASRIRQEVGPFITHNSISGTVAGFEGYYNFYNIGATSSTEPLGAIKNGLQFAKDGKGASEETKRNLLIPWTDPEKAIKGGAVFIGSSYILVGQNNLYLQKFDVNDDRGPDLFWHQYMTNCLAPYSESSSIYKAYSSNGMLDSSIGFVIPVYENMPENWTESPNILASDYKADNTKMYADITGVLNVRTGPSTSYEILTTVTRDDVLTRIKVGVQNGERWDKVQLENGMVGYVFQSYLKEIPKPIITSIKLSIDNNIINKGNTANINMVVQPQEADKSEIVFTSNNEDVLTVDNNGIVTAISSGKAVVTAKNRDGTVSDSIELTVYTKASGITISKEEMSIFVGKTADLFANVLPEDASDKTVKWSSTNNEIATVTQDGKVTALKSGIADIIVKTADENYQAKCKVTVNEIDENITLEFDEKLRIEADEISNIDINKSTIKDIKELINTNLNIEIYNSKDTLLQDTDLVGTGSKLVLKDDTGREIYKFTFIIYGDVNGDGLINSLDVLVIQKHILETKLITGPFLKAGNISKNGNLPSSLDVLKLQKHILEIKLIQQ